MLKQNLRLLIKSLYISVPLALLMIYTVINQIVNCLGFTQNDDVLYFLQDSLTICLISFILLLYASYEFFYRIKRCDVEEALYSCKGGKYKTVASGLLCLMLVPAFQFAVSFVFNSAVFFISGMSDFRYLFHCFSVLILYVFLGGIIPILSGLLLANVFKRAAAYGIFALEVFLISDISDFIFGSLSQNTYVNFWSVKYFLSYFLPNDLDAAVSYDYGLNCEPYRWNLTLFWIFALTLAVIIFCKFKKCRAKATALCLCAALTALNLAGYFSGGSHIEQGAQLDSSSMCDYVYYKNNDADKLTQKADFAVVKYDMDLKIGRRLSADITVSLLENFNKEYSFTLYHDYKIERVESSSGKKLDYKRTGDYLTVYGDRLTQIIISYSGYSSVYYSNSQACALPGYFPYYPMAGCYDFVNLYGTYTPVTDLPKARFSINVDCGRQLFSNLSETDKNTFEGETNCPSLFSGFYKRSQSGGYDICGLTVRGWGCEKIDDEYLNSLQALIDRAGGDVDLKTYKIIQLSPTVLNSGLENSVFYNDDMILLAYTGDAEEQSGIAKSLISQKNERR